MKQLNKALIASAVLAGLSAGNAFAGTEACFEILRVADGFGPDNTEVFYESANCVLTGTGTAVTEVLQPSLPIKAAYEIAAGAQISLESIITNPALPGDQRDIHLVYIPTTDIPSGTLVRIKLSPNARFVAPGNQYHLLRDTGVGSGISEDFVAVASTDGAVNNQNQVTFITRAGVQIAAGTRLVLSTQSVAANAAAISPIAFRVDSAECTNPESVDDVFIRSVSAQTDGGTGFNIEGGVSEYIKVADLSAQFRSFWGNTNTQATEGLVNAESKDSDDNDVIARTTFVFNPDAAAESGEQLQFKANEVVYPAHFFDRSPSLDKYIVLDAGDRLRTRFLTEGDTPDTENDVQMGLFNTASAAGVLDGQISVQPGTLWALFNTPTPYETTASLLFTPVNSAGALMGDFRNEVNNYTGVANPLTGALYNRVYYTIRNQDSENVMNFNYVVNAEHLLDFDDTELLDHCQGTRNTHNIGVNGAVLRVPYQFDASSNFVRITNRHDKSATVTVDLFGESSNGTTGNRTVRAVELGTIPAQSSAVYFVPQVIQAAVDQKDYAGQDNGYAEGALGGINAQSNANRHTLTFTVTAPRNSVEGVAVQRMSTGQERVLPVRDLSDWNQ